MNNNLLILLFWSLNWRVLFKSAWWIPTSYDVFFRNFKLNFNGNVTYTK